MKLLVASFTMTRGLLAVLLWMVFAALARGAWLQWDFGADVGYKAMSGTNSRAYTFTNDVGYTNSVWLPRLRLTPGSTNYFAVTAYGWGEETGFSEEVWWVNTNTYVAPRVANTNVTLSVKAGKFYIEHSGNASVWASSSIVTGPTNIAFPITGTMGFYRYRPYFVSMASTKGGAAKLMTKKAPKPIPIPPTTNAVSIIGPVNLIPPAR